MWTRLWNRCRFLFRRSRAAIGMTRLGVVVGHAPVTEKKPTLFQAHERRIQRPHVQFEDALRDWLHPSREREPCRGPSVARVCRTIRSSVP